MLSPVLYRVVSVNRVVGAASVPRDKTKRVSIYTSPRQLSCSPTFPAHQRDTPRSRTHATMTTPLFTELHRVATAPYAVSLKVLSPHPTTPSHALTNLTTAPPRHPPAPPSTYNNPQPHPLVHLLPLPPPPALLCAPPLPRILPLRIASPRGPSQIPPYPRCDT